MNNHSDRIPYPPRIRSSELLSVRFQARGRVQNNVPPPEDWKALLQKLRRLSTSNVIQRYLNGGDCQLDEREGEQCRAQDTINDDEAVNATLLTLPTETLAHILRYVDFKTLCAVRSTCSAAKDILLEGEVVRQWIGVNCHEQQIALYPPPTPATFLYILEQEHRASFVLALAVQYTNHIGDMIEGLFLPRSLPLGREQHSHDAFRLVTWEATIRRTLDREQHFHDAFRPVKEAMTLKLVPLLLTTLHYLEHFADAILESCKDQSPQHTQTSRDQYAAQRHSILDQYDAKDLLELYKFWLFLTWLINHLLPCPSDVGAIECRARIRTMDVLYERDFNTVLVFGHFAALSMMLSVNTFPDRRSMVQQWRRQLDPTASTLWQDQWRSFSLQRRVPERAQAECAVRVKLQAGEIFVSSARTISVEKGLLNAMTVDSDLEIGTVQQCCAFLRDLAGYDVLSVHPDERPSNN
ncbi:hypothetical protein LTR08_005560 [Meristemomyces frigidus]|nr:hypothetical protein LTR08_005560 [Meristemomyces frigidus]